MPKDETDYAIIGAILDRIADGERDFMEGQARIINLSLDPDVDPNAIHIRLVVPMDSTDDAIARNLAYDLATVYLSNSTNNDACDVVVRERSAHFDSHLDLVDFHEAEFATLVVVDAIVQDYLT